MSLEQLSAPQEVDPAADIFSRGARVAVAASGKGPFGSPSPYETSLRVVEAARNSPPYPRSCSPSSIHLCLEKKPKPRATAHELLHLLRDATLPTTAPRPSWTPPRLRQRRTHLRPATTACTAALAALATTALALTSDEIMDTRFAPADGANTCGRPIESTAENTDFGGSSSGAGTIIGAATAACTSTAPTTGPPATGRRTRPATRSRPWALRRHRLRRIRKPVRPARRGDRPGPLEAPPATVKVNGQADIVGRLWGGDSGVEPSGPPTASRTHLHLASPWTAPRPAPPHSYGRRALRPGRPALRLHGRRTNPLTWYDDWYDERARFLRNRALRDTERATGIEPA
ncbi:hypothetical protein OG866_29160 [Streptomyces sp. NBC_00663]|uniref:hypothetical protein n=1 Tax=Streptomyces sp. NBC_00663 TaxID=2975801 RepID=UPI002E373C42|nr:hypothetical protein [Streptomyces sp. NBC_00663]